MRLLLDLIRLDGGTQARAQLQQRIILEYAQAMRTGYHFPPVVVFYDGAYYWLADGFHRLMAIREVGFKDIEVELKLGTQREAILYAVGANANHGLRRTPADKRHGVKLLLEDKEWGQWSDRMIAKVTVTSHPMVAKVRALLTGNISSERIYTTKHGTVAVMNTAMIGKSTKVKVESYTLQLQPDLLTRLQQYQEEMGIDSIEATLAKLLETLYPNFPTLAISSSVKKRWLGIDPGLAKVGWAVLFGEESQNSLPTLVDYGTIQTEAQRPTSERLWELEQDLVALIREFHPTDVALEIPLINQNHNLTRMVLEAIGVIDLVCYRERGIVPIRLYTSMWKAHLGNGRASELEVTEIIQTLFDLGDVGSSRLDAIGITYAGFCGVKIER